ncbi:2858_t:CDS:2, partial [Dentiscutata erythropus]
MSQKKRKIKYCPTGHSSEDFAYSDRRNYIRLDARCDLCAKEHFIQEFKTWSSGNANIDGIIQDSQINKRHGLQWIPYDNFQNIEHIADGGHGSVYSAKLENGIKWNWNFIQQDWEYDLIGHKVALKEIKDSRYDIVRFLKEIKVTNNYEFIAKYYGISKNPSTQNYIIVMDLFDDNLHNFLTKKFWDLDWKTKLDILSSITHCLEGLHAKNLVHCDLHSGNIFDILKIPRSNSEVLLIIDLGLLEWYLNLMYRCWSDDPSERPTVNELIDLFCDAFEKLSNNIVDNNFMRQLNIADENQRNTSKSQKQELFELFSHSSKLHPQSCYLGRYIYTLHGLHDLLEEIKSGKSS